MSQRLTDMEYHVIKLRQRAQFWAGILARMPGISVVLLSGSLAVDKAKVESDIDFFIIAHPQRIFTARFWILTILFLFRRLAHGDGNHAGKICPNHFITTVNLEILDKDLYSAKTFTRDVFLAGDFGVWFAFREANKIWVKDFSYNFAPISDMGIKPTLHHRNFFGDIVETLCKKLLLTIHRRNKLPDDVKVWLTDLEIRLHPNLKI